MVSGWWAGPGPRCVCWGHAQVSGTGGGGSARGAACSPGDTPPGSPQRQKSTYTSYPKAEPTPVASSAPPASSLYSSPVVSPPRPSSTGRARLLREAREGRPGRTAPRPLALPPPAGSRLPGRGPCGAGTPERWGPTSESPASFAAPGAQAAAPSCPQLWPRRPALAFPGVAPTIRLGAGQPGLGAANSAPPPPPVGGPPHRGRAGGGAPAPGQRLWSPTAPSHQPWRTPGSPATAVPPGS